MIKREKKLPRLDWVRVIFYIYNYQYKLDKDAVYNRILLPCLIYKLYRKKENENKNKLLLFINKSIKIFYSDTNSKEHDFR